MMKFTFWKTKKNNNQELNTENPFTSHAEGRAEWNDRYFSMKSQIKRWQSAFFLLSMVTIILSIAALRNSNLSHIQPVVVETCNGEPKNILPVNASLPDEDRLVKYAIGQFIINSRTIIADADAQKKFLDKAYAYSSGSTIAFLSDYYHKNNPFELASHEISEINIIDSIKISANTWQVTWEESRKNSNGNDLISKTKWVATITVQLGNVNPKFINENPFGIYFPQLTWSQIETEKA